MVSVVSAVYNRAENVARWLESLSRQTVPLEILLTNYGSTDGLESVLENSPVTVFVIHTQREGDGPFPEGRLKNLGIRRATGDVIVGTNTDVTYERAFFERVAAACKEGVLVQAMRRNAPSDADIDAEGNIFLQSSARMSMVNDFGYSGMGAPITAGADCQGMLKKHWHELRGYDEELTGWGALDSDMVCRCLLYGMALNILGHKQARFAHKWHPVDHEKNMVDAQRNHPVIMKKLNERQYRRNLDGWGGVTDTKPGEMA
jgi:glycosyltransferase involved in cell wall biosynthesis